jgi:hypothetical protein
MVISAILFLTIQKLDLIFFLLGWTVLYKRKTFLKVFSCIGQSGLVIILKPDKYVQFLYGCLVAIPLPGRFRPTEYWTSLELRW